uniref:Uncharacterized protein n=1 Tax=Mus spicilegus TaxID=10103 RepID=A0A8C6HZG9_MUSSI
MSPVLPHLNDSWQVDWAIVSKEGLLGHHYFWHSWDLICTRMDEVLYSIIKKKRKTVGDLPHLRDVSLSQWEKVKGIRLLHKQNL